MSNSQESSNPSVGTAGDANRILVSTTPTLEGYHIEQYIQVVSAQTVLGTGLLAEIATWFADKFGIECTTIERKYAAARAKSCQKLQEQALAVGADAVISTSFTYSSNSRSMIGVITTGTAVKTVRR